MPKALVVDDEPYIREMIAFELTSHGFEASFAETGALAKKKFEEENPDIVISDFKMPDGDGLELYQYVKDSSHSVPFILVTAFAGEKKKKFLEAGISHIFSKPLDIDRLIETAERLTET